MEESNFNTCTQNTNGFYDTYKTKVEDKLTEEQLNALQWARKFMNDYEKRNKHTVRKQETKQMELGELPPLPAVHLDI